MIKIIWITILGLIAWPLIKRWSKGDGLVIKSFRNYRDIGEKYVRLGFRKFDLPIGVGFDKLDNRTSYVLSRVLLGTIILGIMAIGLSILIN